MSTVQERIISTLKMIQSNEPCNSNQDDFEPKILSDLHEKCLIKGAIHTPLATGIPEFSGMRLTLEGMQVLEGADAIDDTVSQSSAVWHTNPFLIAILGGVAMVAATGIIYWLGWK